MTKVKEVELNLCKTDFLFCMAFLCKNVFRMEYIFTDFHKKLADVFLSLGDYSRDIINCPPRLGKTLMAQCFIAWKMLNNPAATFLYLSYDVALAETKALGIRDMVAFLAKYFELEDLAVARGRATKGMWFTNAGGYVFAKGTGTGVTGFGCNTCMVVDDPNKATDRTSSKMLSKRNTNFIQQIRNRIDSPEVPIVIIQQRVASTDLTGYLLALPASQWKHHCFPAINADGTALCPERLPVEEVETYKSDPFTYNAQYMQIPLDEIGHLFTRNKLIYTNVRPSLIGLRLCITCDASMKTDLLNDFNAIAVIATDGINYYILEVLNFKGDIVKLCEEIRKLRARYGNNVPVIMEGKANGVAAAQILRKEMSGIMEVMPKFSKVERAMAVKYLFEGLNVKFCCPSLQWPETLSEFSQFPYCEHDDIVDSITQGISWLIECSNTRPPATVANFKANVGSLARRSYGSTNNTDFMRGR